MADNKNQHYVPRVYLKPFTKDGAGLALNLFNLDRMRSIRDAPAKNQCSGDYFYGRNPLLERAIQAVEGPYGGVVPHLSLEGAINRGVAAVLRRFVFLQYLRTDAAAKIGAKMAEVLTDVPGSDLPVPPFREIAKMAVQAAMHEYGVSMRIVDDLKLCIVRNRTSVPCVSSDNPAILTNRLHLQRPPRGRPAFGAKTAGALFLLPLSPTLLAVLHDGDVYSVAHLGNWVDVDREKDVSALNQHQYLNCMANLYFRDWKAREAIHADAAAALPLRPAERLTIVHAVHDETSDWGERYTVQPITDIRDGRRWLTHAWPNRPVPSAWPSFLRFRPDATAWSNETGAGRTRRGCIDQGFVTGVGYRKVRV